MGYKKQFIQIVEQNKDLIYSLCRIYISLEEDRKDAFQDIVLELWKSFPSFRKDSKISTWVYKVALYHLLGKLRKKKPEIIPYDQLPMLFFDGLNAKSSDESQFLEILFNSLCNQEKALLVLHLEGYDYEEIGEILNTSKSNISTRLNRIKIKLRKQFKSEYDEFRQS